MMHTRAEWKVLPFRQPARGAAARTASLDFRRDKKLHTGGKQNPAHVCSIEVQYFDSEFRAVGITFLQKPEQNLHDSLQGIYGRYEV